MTRESRFQSCAAKRVIEAKRGHLSSQRGHSSSQRLRAVGLGRALVASVAVLFGAATLFAGTRVLLGADPGYAVFRPLVVFNTAMGAAYVLAGVAVWRRLRLGTALAGAIVLLNLLALAGLFALDRGGTGIAVQSLAAMAFRTAVWLLLFLAILWLARPHPRP